MLRRSHPYDSAVNLPSEAKLEAMQAFGRLYLAYCKQPLDKPKILEDHEFLFIVCQLVNARHLKTEELKLENQTWVKPTDVYLKATGIFTPTYEIVNNGTTSTEQAKFYEGLNTAEKTCIYALAWQQNNDLAKAIQFAGLFLNKFYHFMPNGIPNYLRDPFIRMLTQNTGVVSYWRAMLLKDSDTLKEVKKQFLAVIASLNDQALKQRALWQIFSEQTFLGALFHIQRGIRFPSMTREGTELNNALQMLNATLSAENSQIQIDEFTKQALWKDKEFFENLNGFPHVFNALCTFGNRSVNQPR